MEQWRRELVTQELLKRAAEELAQVITVFLEGNILAETADETAMNAAKSYGIVVGLGFFMNFKGDEPEEA